MKKSNKNRRISVSYGRTINLGNYESERVQVGIERDLSPSEHAPAAELQELAELMKFVRDYEAQDLDLDYYKKRRR